MSVNRFWAVPGVVAVLILASGTGWAQNLLLNSSFETGTHAVGAEVPNTTAITNWTIGLANGATLPWTQAGSTLVNTNYNQPAGGSKSINLNTDNGSNYLRQTVSLTNGRGYRVAMDLQRTGSSNLGNSSFTVFLASVGGTTALQTFTLPATATNTATMSNSWTTFASYLPFTQITGSYDLVFQFTGPGSVAKDVNVDRVVLAAVPEPGSLALLGLTVGLVPLLRRRRG